ncbi:MAG: phosphate ABC transporter substrate-binding protein PstS [Pyrinomonadaceae bacterium]
MKISTMNNHLKTNLARTFVLILVTFGISTGLSGCLKGSGDEKIGDAISLTGAGATFPNPLYQKWISEYGKLNNRISIDYQSVGSGSGINQIKTQVIDFAGSDAPMTDEDLKKAPGEILHIPTVLGAVALTYNLPAIEKSEKRLRLSPESIADIYLKKITRWNDPRIAADNPGLKLPSAEITVIYRSDGSGTSNVFTDYLSKVSQEWKEKVGKGTSPSWPVGLGGKGNEGVAGLIRQLPNTVAYLELAYATQNHLTMAFIKNRSGNYVEPSIATIRAAAAESLATTPDDLRVSITDSAGPNSYPISSYTYILVYREQKNAAKGKATTDFLWWCLHEGEQYAEKLDYASLPEEIVRRAESKIFLMTADGKKLRT